MIIGFIFGIFFVLIVFCFFIIFKKIFQELRVAWPFQHRYWLVSNYDNINIIGSTDKGTLEHCLKQDNVHGEYYLAWIKTALPVFGVDRCPEE